MDPWVEHLRERLGVPLFTSSDEVRFNCFRPDCGMSGTRDSKYHLYVNSTKGKWFCQRCQRGGSLDYLFSRLGLQSPENSLGLWEKLVHQFLFGDPEKVATQVQATEPLDYHPVFGGTKAHQYLSARGISDTKNAHYSTGFGTARLNDYPKEERDKYAGKNRIIFPDYNEDGSICYWVARTYGKHHAKYKNAKVPRERQVFNLGRIIRNGHLNRIVICEGPISAICAGYDAVATYGKYVTGEQVSRLVKAGAEEYVVAFDGDALLEAVSLATRLQRRGLKTKFVKFGLQDDPASVGSKQIRRMIGSAIPWGGFSSLEVLI